MPKLAGFVMLRLHFSSDDLSRIRFARRPDPLWEAALSLTMLGSKQGRAVFDPWRAHARTELRPLPGHPSWARSLADGDHDVLTRLGQALRDYHRAVIAPYEPRIQTLIDNERATRTPAMLDHGSEAVLRSLAPHMRWSPPVLEVNYPLDHEIHLAGRGLRLMPSAFCWRQPITLIDPDLPPVLVYPVNRTHHWWTTPAGNQGSTALANLLGVTRAACLQVIEDGCTTGELARRVGIAQPTASQHATTLREAGLIATTRLANSVIHTLTPLGGALLTGSGRWPT